MKNVKCPVCEIDLGITIPDFCKNCGWLCGADITLFPTLTPLTEKELAQYRTKLELAKQRWLKHQELLMQKAEEKEGDKIRLVEQQEEEERRKETERKRQEQQEIIDAEVEVLKKRTNDLIRIFQWQEALNVLDRLDQIKPENGWTKDQRINIKVLQKSHSPGLPPGSIPKPGISPRPTINTSKNPKTTPSRSDKKPRGMTGCVLVMSIVFLILWVIVSYIVEHYDIKIRLRKSQINQNLEQDETNYLIKQNHIYKYALVSSVTDVVYHGAHTQKTGEWKKTHVMNDGNTYPGSVLSYSGLI